jgi:cytoskeletal protein RodZ
MAPAMAGVDTAPHQVALTLFAFFIAVIWIVVIAAVTDPRPETTVVEAAMESTSVASEATTVATSKAAHVAASAEATHVAATSAAKATAVATTTTTTTTAAAAVGRQGDIRAQQANRGQRQQGYYRFTKHHSLS